MKKHSKISMLSVFPAMAAVFMGFLVIGVAMPVLPLHVHDGLGMGAFAVGLAAGSQFGCSLVSRVWAGRHSDAHGPKHAVMVGLSVSAMGGLLYLASLQITSRPLMSVALLIAGRGLLGAGESFIMTGAQAWGLVIAGAENTGRVLAWMGIALYISFALGAPAGMFLYDRFGFVSISVATTVLPLVTLIMIIPVRPALPGEHRRTPFSEVIATVWLPGVGAAMSSFGFCAMTTFGALLCAAHGWPVWPAISAFAVSLIVARVALGHLADQMGGALVAAVFVVLEGAGLALLGLAGSFELALAGAILAGFGYSLVYPGFGVEAIKRAPPRSRGSAMGVYSAFLDLTLGIASPVLGLIASDFSVNAVFLVSALVVLGAAGIALRLLRSAPVLEKAMGQMAVGAE